LLPIERYNEFDLFYFKILSIVSIILNVNSKPLGIIIIDIYCNEFTDFEFVPSILETPLYFWFFFITYLASKNLKKNKLTKP
jgi:hypothetical protein